MSRDATRERCKVQNFLENRHVDDNLSLAGKKFLNLLFHTGQSFEMLFRVIAYLYFR